MKTFINSVVLALLALFVFGAYAQTDALKSAVTGLQSQFAGVNYEDEEFLEGLRVGNPTVLDISSTGDITSSGDIVTTGAVNYKETGTSIVGNGTITAAQSGTTFYLNTTGGTTTLPALANGLVYRFVVGSALATANVIVKSLEGDNMEGSLIVAGAVVDCDAEDQINIVIDGENIGDFFEVRSNGTYWFITASNALTAAKMTCTDPS